MTAVQPSLFAPGWEQEPCGDEPPLPLRESASGTPLWEYGRSPARRGVDYWRDIEDVPVGWVL